MESSLQSGQEARKSQLLGRQVLSFFLHAILALASWLALMLIGYAINPAGISQALILVLSMAVPLTVGFVVARIHPSEMAPAVWLLGSIWLMIVGLYVLDLPTGPGRCFQCGAMEKLSRTFFSLPDPSGLMDDDGPFLGTWPAAALVGYSIGAWLGMRQRGQ